MKTKLNARWSLQRQQEAISVIQGRGMPRGMLMLFCQDEVHLAAMLARMASRSDQSEQQLLVTVEDSRDRRSLDANALMWALYDFQSRCMNARVLHLQDRVTKDELYRRDMMEFAEVYQVTCQETDLPKLKRYGWSWQRAVPAARHGYITVDLMITSSKWDSLRMHQHIEMLFNRLADLEPDENDDVAIRAEWIRWRESIDTERVQLHEETLTADEYRALNRHCEGCGRNITRVGHIHHISSRGSHSVDPSIRDTAANWMHLCAACHAIWTSPEGGRRRFVELYPHTTNRVFGQGE